MGKVLKIVAIVIAIAVIVYAPQISGAILGAIGVTSAIAAAVLATAITMGATFAISRLTAPKPSALGAGPPQVFRQSIANSFIVYGKRRVGGLLVFFHSKKHTDGKHYRYFVIACAGHRCKGVVDWMLNDDVVTVDGSGMVTSGPYASAAWLWFVRGTDSDVANATFVSECGGKWTTDHKGLDVAKIYAKFRMNDAVIEAGMPNITAVIEGKDDIRDPRDDTEDYTRNAALIFNDWMAIPREEGGYGAYSDEIPDDDWISAQANVSDETVEGEERYAFDAVITTGAAPSEVRDSFIVNCAGSYTFSEGVHKMRVGYWVAPSETLTEDQLAGPIQFQPFMTSDVAANEVQVSFIDPANGYQGGVASTQTTDPAPTDIRQIDLDLAFVTSSYRAQRIASIMLKRAQCEKTGTWPMNIEGLKTGALDVVQLGTDRYGLSNYAFVVTNWGLSADYGVTLSLKEENEDIYADPTPVTPDAVDTIDVPAAPILTESNSSTLIKTSEIIDADPPDGVLQATDTTITIEGHTRRYADKEATVDGDTAAVAAPVGEWNHVYYDDLDREGGAVTYVVTTDPVEASNSPDNPGRHWVGSVKTDEAGGTGTSGGGQSPPGWDPNIFYNQPEIVYDGGTA